MIGEATNSAIYGSTTLMLPAPTFMPLLLLLPSPDSAFVTDVIARQPGNGVALPTSWCYRLNVGLRRRAHSSLSRRSRHRSQLQHPPSAEVAD